MRKSETWIWLKEKLRPISIFTLGLIFGGASFSLKAQEPFQFRNDVIAQYPMGHVDSGNYALRASVTTIAADGNIPWHVHEFGGFRYMLEGALTMQWKEKGTQTFTQGSTYYEGPGENHPSGVMAAHNPSDKTSRLLIVELVPVN